MTKKDINVKSVAKKGYFTDRINAIIKLHDKKLAEQKDGGKD